MTKDSFPVNEAKLLIEIPKDISRIGFLGGEQGKEINDSIQKDYKDFNVLKVGKYSNNIVKGSNPFYAIAVQSKLPLGVRVASQSDLETAMRISAMDFSGTYEDTGLVLRTEGDPNSYSAKNLTEQIKARLGKKAKVPSPILIQLYDLELEKDQNSPHGLAFKLKDNAEITYAPILIGKNNGKSFSETDENGLPKELGEGTRTLYTRDSGLSGLCLSRNLNLNSDYDYLAYSSDDGRVVVVSTAEGGSQEFFNQKLAEFQKIRDAKIEKVNQAYSELTKEFERRIK